MKGQFEFSWVIVVIILVVILILFITRELWCWYYKINKQCSLLEEQNALLNKLLNEQAQSNMMMNRFLASRAAENDPAGYQSGMGAPQRNMPNDPYMQNRP